jgi:membrane protease YdiL (CAAX protease family)
MPFVAAAAWSRPDPLASLGAAWPRAGGWGAAFTALIVLIVVAQTSALLFLRDRLFQNAAMRRTLESVQLILPRTPVEQRWWAGVSLTAGVWEEMLYRGFLFRYFQSVWGWTLPATVAASSALFGLAHIYQGARAALTAAVLSSVLGVVYAVTGSLLVPILLHAIMDLRSLLLSRHLEPDGSPLPATTRPDNAGAAGG